MPLTDEEILRRESTATAAAQHASAAGDHQRAGDIMRGLTDDLRVAELDAATAARVSDSTPSTDTVRNTMTAPTAPASEATSIRSVIASLEATAAAHASIAGNEGFLGSLQRMEVGEADQQRFLAAQEASRNAAQAWKVAVDSVRRNNDPVGEAYRTSPGAANKEANTNE